MLREVTILADFPSEKESRKIGSATSIATNISIKA